MGIFGSRRQPEPEHPPQPERERVLPPAQPTPPEPIPPQPIGFETVLGANSTLEGTLISNANVRLDGSFTGKLEINGNVLIGETAKITADVSARNLSIAGAVRGNVTGKKVQLLRTGRVWGDITATALSTEEGAFIEGKISMVSHAATQEPPAPVSEVVETPSAPVAASYEEIETGGDAEVMPEHEPANDPVDTPQEPDFLQADDMEGRRS